MIKKKGSMMIKNKIARYLSIVTVSLFCGSMLHASCAPDDMISIKNAWARANVAENGNSAIYMEITNNAPMDDQLIRAEADVCGKVELHETVQNGNVFKMNHVHHVALPSHKTMHFKPGGHHIMLIGLKEGLKEGDVVQVTLHFKNSPSKTVLADVKKTAEKKKKCNCDCGCKSKKSKKAKKPAKKKTEQSGEMCHSA